MCRTTPPPLSELVKKCEELHSLLEEKQLELEAIMRKVRFEGAGVYVGATLKNAYSLGDVIDEACFCCEMNSTCRNVCGREVHTLSALISP